MRIRWYADEDAMDSDLVDALRRRGVDVVTANNANMVGHDDEEHLAYATTHDRVLYSFNARDYMKLHALYLRSGRSHAGIVLGPQQQWSVGEQMRRLLRLMATLDAEEMHDRVEFLGAWGDEA